jgi:type IV secretory pathway VirB10-like protein
MRKHLLYSVVFAAILGTGVLTLLPTSKNIHNNNHRSVVGAADAGAHFSGTRSSGTRLDPNDTSLVGAPIPLEMFEKVAAAQKAEELRTAEAVAAAEAIFGAKQQAAAAEAAQAAAAQAAAAQAAAVQSAAEQAAAEQAAAAQAAAQQAAAQQAAAQQAAAEQAAQQASSAQSQQADTSSAPDPSGGVWAELRQCESGGDYSDDTGNGYYGAYQFSLSTWESLGYSGLPSDAPPSEQDAAAQQLQAQSGWGQWPACAAELGLT